MHNIIKKITQKNPLDHVDILTVALELIGQMASQSNPPEEVRVQSANDIGLGRLRKAARSTYSLPEHCVEKNSNLHECICCIVIGSVPEECQDRREMVDLDEFDIVWKDDV